MKDKNKLKNIIILDNYKLPLYYIKKFKYEIYNLSKQFFVIKNDKIFVDFKMISNNNSEIKISFFVENF